MKNVDYIGYSQVRKLVPNDFCYCDVIQKI